MMILNPFFYCLTELVPLLSERSHLLQGIPMARKLEDSVSLQPFPVSPSDGPGHVIFRAKVLRTPLRTKEGWELNCSGKQVPTPSMLTAVLWQRRDPCRAGGGSWCGHRNERTATSQAVREAAVQNPKNQTKRKQANRKTLLWLQPGTQDSKQRRLESQYVLPWGNGFTWAKGGRNAYKMKSKDESHTAQAQTITNMIGSLHITFYSISLPLPPYFLSPHFSADSSYTRPALHK